MPRTEARIFISIWRDEDFTSLPPSAQRLYLFLLSQHDLSYSGVMPLIPQRWAAKAAGMTIADIERDLKTLEGTAYPSLDPDPARTRTPFVIIDRDTGELLVRSLIRRDGIWKQPNLLKQARDTADLIESPCIRAALLAELRRLPLEETTSDLVIRVIGEFTQDLEKGSAYPSAYPSPDPIGDPAGETSGNPLDIPSADPAQGIGGSYGLNQGVPPVPPFPDSPAPTDLPARDRKLGTRLPDNFTPSPEMFDWFRKNCPHVDGKTEHAQFCDYWLAKPGKDGRKLDWPATWRRWMRTAEERSGPRTRGTPSAPQSTTAERAQQAIDAGHEAAAILAARGEK
jgi:hypothetical protein